MLIDSYERAFTRKNNLATIAECCHWIKVIFLSIGISGYQIILLAVEAHSDKNVHPVRKKGREGLLIVNRRESVLITYYPSANYVNIHSTMNPYAANTITNLM